MIRQISIKTKLKWIRAFEKKGRIFKVKFGKRKNKCTSKSLKKFKVNLNRFSSKGGVNIKKNIRF